MKILVSAYACTPNRGSEPGNGWHWTLENARLGHEVWCFTTTEGRQAIEAALERHSGLSINVVYIESPAWANYMYRFQPFVYVHYIVWQQRAYKVAKELDRRENFDLILHVTLASFQLGSALWRLNKPFIYGPVGGGNLAPEAFRKYFLGWWKMEVIRKWVSDAMLLINPDAVQTARRASLVLVANTDTYRMARRVGASRVQLCLDTALPAGFFPGKLPDRKHVTELNILWVGRIFARKGLLLVLEALSKVRRDVPFRLTILGDGKQGHLVPGWLEQFGLKEKTTWRGQVPWEEVRRAYKTHNLFMLCSLRDSFGSQFLEAMAYGLPVIALDHQGAGDHIPGICGIKVPVTTPADTVNNIARAVEYMYDHPAARERFSRCGYDFARSQNWGAKVRQVASCYSDVVAGKKKRHAPAFAGR